MSGVRKYGLQFHIPLKLFEIELLLKDLDPSRQLKHEDEAEFQYDKIRSIL